MKLGRYCCRTSNGHLRELQFFSFGEDKDEVIKKQFPKTSNEQKNQSIKKKIANRILEIPLTVPNAISILLISLGEIIVC